MPTTDLSNVPVSDIEGARDALGLPDDASKAEVGRAALREIQDQPTPVATANLDELATVIEEANEDAIDDSAETISDAVREGVEAANGDDVNEQELANEIMESLAPVLRNTVHAELVEHGAGRGLTSAERDILEEVIHGVLPLEDGALRVRHVDD